MKQVDQKKQHLSNPNVRKAKAVQPKSDSDQLNLKGTEMSNISSSVSTINTSYAPEMPSINIPENSVIKIEGSKTDIQSESTDPLEYRNPNVAYQPCIAINIETKKEVTTYEKVDLPPAIYKQNQTLESVVAEADNIVPQTRADYVNQYRVAEARSAREILTMCRLVYEASKSLNSAEFNAFCRDIGYKDYSSVIRKLTIIGKIQPRLIAHADLLPASWSSIYALTQIPAQAFENMIHMNRSFKEMTVAEVSKLVKTTRNLNKLDDIIKPALVTAEEKNDKILGSTVLAKVYFTKIPDDLDWHTFEKALLEVQANLPVRIQLLSVAKEVFTLRKDKRYEKLKVKQAPSPYKPEAWDMGREVNKMSTTPLHDPDAAMNT
jgi:ribosomal protein S18